MIVCRDCGSQKVTYTTWVDPNTRKITANGDGTDATSTFCKQCKSYNGLCYLKDFTPKTPKETREETLRDIHAWASTGKR